MSEELPENNTSTEVEKEQSKPFKENIKSRSIWLRLFFMLVVAFVWGVTRVVIGAVVVMQFFWVLFTSETNKGLKAFGAQLATYSYQVISYLTFNAEERPFPFDLDWPKE